MYYLGPVRHGANIIHSKKPIRSIDDFNGLRIRLPGGMVAELFQAAGAKTTMLPGSEILDALAQANLDAADYTGQAANIALGFPTVAKYTSLRPAAFLSTLQPVYLYTIHMTIPPLTTPP